jgi:hypothetical protein
VCSIRWAGSSAAVCRLGGDEFAVVLLVEADAFPTSQPTSWSQDHVPFDALMGIGGLEGMTSLLDTPYLVKEWGLSSPIVLLSGDGHCWIGLDYRGRGPDSDPSVEHDLLPRLKWGPVPAARVGPPG